MSPSEIQRTLTMTHPSKYSIPTIKHIKNFIASLSQAKKKVENYRLGVYKFMQGYKLITLENLLQKEKREEGYE